MVGVETVAKLTDTRTRELCVTHHAHTSLKPCETLPSISIVQASSVESRGTNIGRGPYILLSSYLAPNPLAIHSQDEQ
jgi:hypothetical protein